MTETSYGLAKRLQFVSQIIAERNPRRVLDVGCGTGMNLTAPLAKHFPDVEFVGVDSDPVSIEFAQKNVGRQNLTFQLVDTLAADEQFDGIIASEVLEHVEDPDRFLRDMRCRLRNSGFLVITCPNGYGPFEWGALAQTLLVLTGVFPMLQALKYVLRGRPRSTQGTDTLAVSPHVNFFSKSTVERLARAAAMDVEHYCPRVFLCGFGFDYLIKGSLIPWNARVADRLPAWINSSWMFVLKPCAAAVPFQYRRVPDARLRRWLSRRRWGLR
jgi:2-polyprenyl-3-methyl-5-hydroxy-6-metoxy-1,4-benzoquinol methylase